MSKINHTEFPYGPCNAFVYFISHNPRTTFNPVAEFPKIHPTAFVDPFSSIIGDVTINAKIFIAPNVSVRADEGTPF